DPEVSGTQLDFMDGGLRGGFVDGAHGCRRCDLVTKADKTQNRHGDIREAHRFLIDDQSAVGHEVFHDDFVNKSHKRGCGPRDKSFAVEESTAGFAFHQCVAVGKKIKELDNLFDFFAHAQKFESCRRQKSWQCFELFEGSV